MTYSNASRVAGAAGQGHETSALMLTELQKAHGDLLSGMAVMDAVTGEPVADPYRHSKARWHLSQTGLTASILLGNILSHLLPEVASREVTALKSIQLAHLDLLRTSTDHVGEWSIDKIQEDWAGYCAGYRTFRWNLTACIAAEKRLLYPLLTKQALRGISRQV